MTYRVGSISLPQGIRQGPSQVNELGTRKSRVRGSDELLTFKVLAVVMAGKHQTTLDIGVGRGDDVGECCHAEGWWSRGLECV